MYEEFDLVDGAEERKVTDRHFEYCEKDFVVLTQNARLGELPDNLRKTLERYDEKALGLPGFFLVSKPPF